MTQTQTQSTNDTKRFLTVTAGTPDGEGRLPSAAAYRPAMPSSFIPSDRYDPWIVNGEIFEIGFVQIAVSNVGVHHMMGRTDKTLSASQEEMRAYTEGHMAAVARAAAFAAALRSAGPVATLLAGLFGGQWTLSESFGAGNSISAQVTRGDETFTVLVTVGEGTIQGQLHGATSPEALHTGVLAAAILGASELSLVDPSATEVELAGLITAAAPMGFGPVGERRTVPLHKVALRLGEAEIKDLDEALEWLRG